MNKCKTIIAMSAAICLMFLLSACSGKNEKYEVVEGFERHFVPEEYDSEYSKISEVFTLNEGTDYQLQLDAKCESGKMEISILCEGADEKIYSIDPETPCNEILMIPADSVNEVTIVVSIELETKGDVIGKLCALND